mmetsp:Transcript_35169/g.109503  ORF Transcript_35169/g.109503 Transcript_35169/m.109503 type:complete len:269 (-) Transcript_35169:98-904(-)
MMPMMQVNGQPIMLSSTQYQPVLEEGSATQMDDCSMAADYCCRSGEAVRVTGGLIPCQSMELSNDPRFFNDNVIDKRLTSFTALSVVSSLMAGAACDNFFPFLDSSMGIIGSETPVKDVLQLVGFCLMCMVLFLNVMATMVFGVQFYFTYRLMTSGPVGFESARSFYLDSNMTYWRQLSAKALIWGMPMFVLSIGCMLFVKFYDKNRNLQVESWLTFLSFLAFAAFLLRIGIVSQRTFASKYYVGSGLRPLLADMETGRGTPAVSAGR